MQTKNKEPKNITVKNIPVADICPSELNPRKTFDQESLAELAQNIKEHGLVQPITIRKRPKGKPTPSMRLYVASVASVPHFSMVHRKSSVSSRTSMTSRLLQR